MTKKTTNSKVMHDNTITQDEMEFLKSLDYNIPIRISSRKYKNGENTAAILYSYSTLKKEVLKFEKSCNGIINQQLLKRTNSLLYNSLATWSNLLDESKTPAATLRDMGILINTRMDSEGFKERMRTFFTRELIMRFYSNGFKQKDLFSIVKGSKETESLFSSRKYFSKQGIEVSDIIDEAYPDITESTGLLPSLIMGLKPWSHETIKSQINKLFYNDADIREQSQTHSWIGDRLVYFIKYPNSRPTTPNMKGRKSVKRGYGSSLPEYFDFEKCTPGHLIGANGSRSHIAKIMEYTFAFFLKSVQKLDPHMVHFKELRKHLDQPIEKVYDPNIEVDKTASTGKEADIRLKTCGKSVLVEVKRSEYSNENAFFKSLVRYKHVASWKDGTTIDDKLLLIGETNSTFEIKRERLVPDGWKVLGGKEYSEIYHRMLGMLGKTGIDKTCIMNSYLDELFDMTHEKAYITSRVGHRHLRSIVTKLMRLNLRYLDGEDVFTPTERYAFHYQIRLSDFTDIYSVPIAGINKGYVFYDTEATGLSRNESQIITTSLGHFIEDDFVVDVYLARTPFEERRVISETRKIISSADALVIFNVPYDWPLFEARSFCNMIPPTMPKMLIELRNNHRKKKNSGYASNTLKSLEKVMLGVDRRGDSPSSAIPIMYDNYLLGKDKPQLLKMIYHTAFDVLPMPTIMMHDNGYSVEQTPREVTFERFLRSVRILEG